MYKLINTNTKEEHLCDKVTIDGFDYYVSDDEILYKTWYYNSWYNGVFYNCEPHKAPLELYSKSEYWNQFIGKGINKKIIATTDQNIDIPKVVDEVEILHKDAYVKHSVKDDKLSFDEQIQRSGGFIVGYKEGYNKSQETHSNSDEDMFGFHFWLLSNSWLYHPKHNVFVNSKSERKSGKELLQLWKEQQPKKIYYNK